MSADALLRNLTATLGPESRTFMCRKLGALLKVFTVEDPKDFPEVSVESFQTLLQTLSVQLECSVGKDMANMRNDLASLVLLLAKEKKELRKEFGTFGNKIGQLVSENVIGSDTVPAFPLSSRPLDIQLLKIFTHLLNLVLKGHLRPVSVVDTWCLVETGIVMLIGPCPLLDTVMGDEGLVHGAWELLHTLVLTSPGAFASDEGLPAILSYLDVYVTSGSGGKVNMTIMAIFLDILRSLSTAHHFIRQFLIKQNALAVLVGVLGRMSGTEWDITEDSTMSNLLLTIASLCAQNDAQQVGFLEVNGVKILLRLLNRLIYASPHKRHMDPLLGMSIGECIWCCLGSCPSCLETFLGFEGMFRLLDFLEMSPSRGVQLTLLNALLDLSEYPRCLDQVLYWKRRLPRLRDHVTLPQSSIGDEVGTRVQGHDLSLGALLCELWRKEEEVLDVGRSPEGLIANLNAPLLSDSGRKSRPTPDLVHSIRPKIYLLTKKITEVTNTEATLFGSLSTKNQVTMELIIHFMDLKMGEVWTEMVKSLAGSPLVSTDAAALEKYACIAKNKAMVVLDTQQFLLCRDQEQKLIQERDLHLKLRKTSLQGHFEGVRELEALARTSNYPLLVEKRIWQKTQLAKARRDTAPSLPEGARVHLTTNQLNVTAWWDGTTKMVESEEVGFLEEETEEWSWKEVGREGGKGEDIDEEPQMGSETTGLSPFQVPHKPSSIRRSVDDTPGLSPKEQGFYQVNAQSLSKALRQALTDEKKWNWRTGEDTWRLRTKWRSNWYH